MAATPFARMDPLGRRMAAEKLVGYTLKVFLRDQDGKATHLAGRILAVSQPMGATGPDMVVVRSRRTDRTYHIPLERVLAFRNEGS